MNFKTHSVIGTGSILGGFEVPDVSLSAIDMNGSPPFLLSLVPVNSLEPGTIVVMPRHVPLVLSVGTGPKVLPSVIKGISVDVVSVHSVGGIKDNAVHEDGTAALSLMRTDTTDSTPSSAQPPAVDEDALGICHVDDGKLSFLIEGDKHDIVYAHRVLLTLGAMPGAVTSGCPDLSIK